MPTIQHILLRAALAALLCLPAIPSHSQAGTTHKGYRGHGIQVTYPSFLTVSEVDPTTVSFTYEGAGFSVQKVDIPDSAAVLAQLREQMPARQLKVTSFSADRVEATGQNGWFLSAVAVPDHGSTYVLFAFGPTQIYNLINQQFADIQRTLVFDGKSTFGQGGALTPSTGGCPGCADSIMRTMNNLTQNTAAH